MNLLNLIRKNMPPSLRFLSAMAQHQLPLDVANEPGQASFCFGKKTGPHQTRKSETAVNMILFASKNRIEKT